MNTTEQGREEGIEISGGDGRGEKTATAVSVGHLAAACTGFPFTLEGILKSIGSLVDKPRTCFEYESFHPEQRTHKAGSFGLDQPDGGFFRRLEYFYVERCRQELITHHYEDS